MRKAIILLLILSATITKAQFVVPNSLLFMKTHQIRQPIPEVANLCSLTVQENGCGSRKMGVKDKNLFVFMPNYTF